jgi:hypothetical protein
LGRLMTCLVTRIVGPFFDVASAAANFLVAEFYCTCTRELLPDCLGSPEFKKRSRFGLQQRCYRNPTQNP